MFENIAILVSIILLGYFAKCFDVLKKEDASALTKLLIIFMLPALTVGNFSKVEFNLDLIYFTISAAIILFVFLVLGFGLSRVLKLKEKTSKSFIIMFGSYWGATLAYPVILINFGDVGFQRFLFYDLVLVVLTVTVLNYIAMSENKYSLKENVRKLLTNPMFLSLPIALILNLINFQSTFTDSLFDIIPKGIVFLGLMIVGLNLDFNVSNFKLPLFVIVFKTLIGLLAGIFTIYFFGFTGMNQALILIASTLPPSLMAMIFSQEYKLDTKFVANTLSLSLPVYLVVLSFILYFF